MHFKNPGVILGEYDESTNFASSVPNDGWDRHNIIDI